MSMLRCGNCGMYGNKHDVKYKITQSIMLEKLYAFHCCKHCNDKTGVLLSQYGKIEITSREQIDKLDHWDLKIRKENGSVIKG